VAVSENESLKSKWDTWQARDILKLLTFPDEARGCPLPHLHDHTHARIDKPQHVTTNKLSLREHGAASETVALLLLLRLDSRQQWPGMREW